ncbi:hypothetical protein D3C81_1802620 [compost metagenome]
MPLIWPEIDPSVVLSFSIPLTVLIWASWVVSSLFCIGLVGSWFFNCATNSVRKLLLRSWLVLPFAPLLAPVPAMLLSSDSLVVAAMAINKSSGY